MLAFKSPRRCQKCLNRMEVQQFVIFDECLGPCLLGVNMETIGEGDGKHGHLHWQCPDCGWREATLPADQSGYDRWKQ